MKKMRKCEEWLIAADQLWFVEGFTWTQGRRLFGAVFGHRMKSDQLKGRGGFGGGASADISYNKLLAGCLQRGSLIRTVYKKKPLYHILLRWDWEKTPPARTINGKGPYYSKFTRVSPRNP